MSISQIPTNSTPSVGYADLVRKAESILTGDLPSSKRNGEASTTPSREATGDVERLGSITNYVTTSENREAIQEHQYELLETVASLLPEERVSQCMRFTVPGEAMEGRYNFDTGHASYGNVALCGSVWTCPICGQRINYQRGEELHKAVEHCKQFGGSVVMATFTLRHSIEDQLADLLDVLKLSWRKTKAGRSWKLFKERHGILGYVTATEVLYSFRNGWHPHLHVLIFLTYVPNESETKDIESWLSHRWTQKIAKYGGYASPIYGLVVREADSAARYITKWGNDSSWDISREMTGSISKVGHGWSPFELLDKFRQGDAQAGYLFREYAKAMKGKRQLTWSHGLRAVLLLDVELTEDELALKQTQEEANAVPVIFLSQFQWAVVVRQQRRAELLRVIEFFEGDTVLIWQYLESIGVKRIRPGPEGHEAYLEALRVTAKHKRVLGGFEFVDGENYFERMGKA